MLQHGQAKHEVCDLNGAEKERRPPSNYRKLKDGRDVVLKYFSQCDIARTVAQLGSRRPDLKPTEEGEADPNTEPSPKWQHGNRSGETGVCDH